MEEAKAQSGASADAASSEPPRRGGGDTPSRAKTASASAEESKKASTGTFAQLKRRRAAPTSQTGSPSSARDEESSGAALDGPRLDFSRIFLGEPHDSKWREQFEKLMGAGATKWIVGLSETVANSVLLVTPLREPLLAALAASGEPDLVDRVAAHTKDEGLSAEDTKEFFSDQLERIRTHMHEVDDSSVAKLRVLSALQACATWSRCKAPREPQPGASELPPASSLAQYKATDAFMKALEPLVFDEQMDRRDDLVDLVVQHASADLYPPVRRLLAEAGRWPDDGPATRPNLALAMGTWQAVKRAYPKPSHSSAVDAKVAASAEESKRLAIQRAKAKINSLKEGASAKPDAKPKAEQPPSLPPAQVALQDTHGSQPQRGAVLTLEARAAKVYRQILDHQRAVSLANSSPSSSTTPGLPGEEAYSTPATSPSGAMGPPPTTTPTLDLHGEYLSCFPHAEPRRLTGLELLSSFGHLGEASKTLQWWGVRRQHPELLAQIHREMSSRRFASRSEEDRGDRHKPSHHDSNSRRHYNDGAPYPPPSFRPRGRSRDTVTSSSPALHRGRSRDPVPTVPSSSISARGDRFPRPGGNSGDRASSRSAPTGTRSRSRDRPSGSAGRRERWPASASRGQRRERSFSPPRQGGRRR